MSAEDISKQVSSELKRQGFADAASSANRETYTPDQLAELLGVGRTAIYKGLRDGTIPSIRFGKRFIIPKAGIAEWLKKTGK
jgi:excisionase family DNA binding protein